MESLWSAGAANHQSMFAAAAAAAGGSVWHRFGGPVATTPGNDVLVGFPEVPPDAQSEFSAEVIAYARKQDGLRQVGWWSMDDAGAGRLGSRLLARGFQWGWRPTWMALDTNDLVEDLPVPAELSITESEPDEPSLAYWKANLNGAEVGSITLLCAEFAGELVGGIYETSVLPDVRRQGIGTALTVAACRRARELGCRSIVLNATPLGVPVYRRTGFQPLGEVGQTWWMTEQTLRAPAPDPAAVELVEAIGDGDQAAVERTMLAANIGVGTALECGLTVAEIATVVGQPDLASWLTQPAETTTRPSPTPVQRK